MIPKNNSELHFLFLTIPINHTRRKKIVLSIDNNNNINNCDVSLFNLQLNYFVDISIFNMVLEFNINNLFEFNYM